jgi:hypothetical protein
VSSFIFKIRTILGKFAVEYEKHKTKEQIKLFGWDLEELMKAKNALLKYQAKLGIFFFINTWVLLNLVSPVLGFFGSPAGSLEANGH